MSITKQEDAHVRINPFRSPSPPVTEFIKAHQPDRPHLVTRESNYNVMNLQNVHPAASVDVQAPPSNSRKEVMTLRNPPKNFWRVIAVCIWVLAVGFSDAAPGVLLPSMETHYNISYAVVSLIWMSNACGFIVVACLSHKILPWLGKRWSLTTGVSSSMIGYICIAPGGPFGVVCLGFFFSGIGLAIVVSQCNIFLTKLDKQSKYLSFFHGCYGAGATVSPLAATSMVNRGMEWNEVYYILIGLMVICNVMLTWAFRGADEDLQPWDHDDDADLIIRRTRSPDVDIELESANGSSEEDRQASPVPTHRGPSDLILALKNPSTWYAALFVFLYQGSEVSLGGWIVTFLLDYRDVGDSYGYVSSGFWAGLTIGRLALTRPLHKTTGLRKSIIMMALLAILMVTLSWVVPNGIAVGVFVGFAGLFIGPTYPLMITTLSFIVPRKIQVVSLTIMSAFGSSGGAFFPFLTGLIAQSQGAYIVLPTFIAIHGFMLVFLVLLPNIEGKPNQPDDGTWRRLWHRVW